MQVDIAIQVELESPLHIGSGSLADALAMIQAGATRLGTSAGVQIMREAMA